MKLPISQGKRPIGRKCENWASFLGIRNRLSNARENPFPGGYGLSCQYIKLRDGRALRAHVCTRRALARNCRLTLVIGRGGECTPRKTVGCN